MSARTSCVRRAACSVRHHIFGVFRFPVSRAMLEAEKHEPGVTWNWGVPDGHITGDRAVTVQP